MSRSTVTVSRWGNGPCSVTFKDWGDGVRVFACDRANVGSSGKDILNAFKSYLDGTLTNNFYELTKTGLGDEFNPSNYSKTLVVYDPNSGNVGSTSTKVNDIICGDGKASWFNASYDTYPHCYYAYDHNGRNEYSTYLISNSNTNPVTVDLSRLSDTSSVKSCSCKISAINADSATCDAEVKTYSIEEGTPLIFTATPASGCKITAMEFCHEDEDGYATGETISGVIADDGLSATLTLEYIESGYSGNITITTEEIPVVPDNVIINLLQDKSNLIHCTMDASYGEHSAVLNESNPSQLVITITPEDGYSIEDVSKCKAVAYDSDGYSTGEDVEGTLSVMTSTQKKATITLKYPPSTASSPFYYGIEVEADPVVTPAAKVSINLLQDKSNLLHCTMDASYGSHSIDLDDTNPGQMVITILPDDGYSIEDATKCRAVSYDSDGHTTGEDITGVLIPISDTQKKATITINYPTSEANSPYYYGIEVEASKTAEPPAPTAKKLYEIFKLSSSQLEAMSNAVWVVPGQDSLSEGAWKYVVSIKVYPVPVKATTTAEIGNKNFTFGISAPVVNPEIQEYNLGSFKIPRKFGDFRDYEPYSRYVLYLPFIGNVELRAEDIVGRTMYIHYKIDFLGDTALVSVSNGEYVIDYETTYLSDEYPMYREFNINYHLDRKAMHLSDRVAKLMMFTYPTADGYSEIIGDETNVVDYIKNLHGYVVAREVDFGSKVATRTEIDEVETLLKSGIEI